MGDVIQRLRGQLQNCVNHLERAKRHWPRGGYDECIESANRCLYETLDADPYAELEALRERVRALEGAITEHNAQCRDACNREMCGYAHYPNRSCPSCPEDWVIALPDNPPG